MRGLFFEGLISRERNLHFKISWASLIVGSKFTVSALFYFVVEGNFRVQVPGGGLCLEGPFNGGFFALPVWGAYIWRDLFSEFYDIVLFSSITYLEPSLQSTYKEEFSASSSALIIVFPSLSHQMSSSPGLAKPKTKLLINTLYVKKICNLYKQC